jgi:hypothetical protein
MPTIVIRLAQILPELTVFFIVLGNLTGFIQQAVFPYLVSYLIGVYWFYFLGLTLFDKHEWHAVAMSLDSDVGKAENSVRINQDSVLHQNRPEYLILFITIMTTPIFWGFLQTDRSGEISQLLNQELVILVCLYSSYSVARLLISRNQWLTMPITKRMFEMKVLQINGIMQVVGTIGCIFAVLYAINQSDLSNFVPAYIILPVFAGFILTDLYWYSKENTFK